MRWMLVVTLVAGAAIAEEPRGHDWVLLCAAEALIAADTMQSLDIRHHVNRDYTVWSEREPIAAMILGEHPSDTAFIAAGATVGILTAAVWYNLPQRWRWALPSAIILIEGLVVAHNASVGLRLRF